MGRKSPLTFSVHSETFIKTDNWVRNKQVHKMNNLLLNIYVFFFFFYVENIDILTVKTAENESSFEFAVYIIGINIVQWWY